MGFRTVFDDESGNELDVYPNSKGDLFIGINHNSDEPMGSGFVTMKKQDVQELIRILTEYLPEINEDEFVEE